MESFPNQYERSKELDGGALSGGDVNYASIYNVNYVGLIQLAYTK